MLGDLHYALTPPGGRAHGYSNEIEALLNEAAILGKLHRVDARLFVGDLFHSKGNTTHEAVAGLAETLVSSRGGATWEELSIPGNHDMQGNNLENALRQQPYAVLTRSGMMTDLSQTYRVFGDFEVVVAGVPFSTNPDLSPKAIARCVRNVCKSKPSALVLLTHHEMTPDGSLGVNGSIFAGELMAELGCPVAVVNGHLHVDPTCTPVHHGKLCGYYVNIGTLARTAVTDSDNAAALLVDYDIARPKSVALSARLIPLHNLARGDAFVEGAAVQTSEPVVGLDDFVKALTSEAGGAGLNPLAYVRQLAAAKGSPDRVLAKAEQLIGESR